MQHLDYAQPSQQDGSFERPKHMFTLNDKNLITILRKKGLLIWTYADVTIGLFNELVERVESFVDGFLC